MRLFLALWRIKDLRIWFIVCLQLKKIRVVHDNSSSAFVKYIKKVGENILVQHRGNYTNLNMIFIPYDFALHLNKRTVVICKIERD